MRRLIQWSIDHHWMVMVFSSLLLLGGIWTARDMPVDVFPDLTAPTVTILAEVPIVTSARKLHWYTPGQLVRQFAVFLIPGTRRRRDRCATRAAARVAGSPVP